MRREREEIDFRRTGEREKKKRVRERDHNSDTNRLITTSHEGE